MCWEILIDKWFYFLVPIVLLPIIGFTAWGILFVLCTIRDGM